jgi:ferredoxin
MTVKVDKTKCIGCGLCASIAPEVFEIGKDGLSNAKNQKGDKKFPEKTKEAAESCPVQAIVITK